jgi:tRNA modification GTPase
MSSSHSVVHARVLTGVGRSAVAVIEVRGGGWIECLKSHFQAATLGVYREGQIRYGRWGDGDDGESVVVTPLRNDVVEIHCHGGLAAIERIMADLVSNGAKETALWAVEASSERSRMIAEATEVLSRCTTAKTAAIVMDQVRGALADWFESTNQMPSEQRRASAKTILERSSLTMRLERPFEVVLVGPPNVGKSSLVNAMVGYERSIVLDQPGTTRDVLAAETVIDGWPIRFRDTAGIRATDEAIEQEGIARAKAIAAKADLVLRISDPGSSIAMKVAMSGAMNETMDDATDEDISVEMTEAWPDAIDVFNKSDLIDRHIVPKDAIATIATTGQGIAELQTYIVQRLTGPKINPGSPVVLNERQKNLVQSFLQS